MSRQFRESLKAGSKPEIVDTIFKLPDIKQTSRHGETVANINNDKVRLRWEGGIIILNTTVKANVVYNSKSPNDLYPEGEYIRGDLSSSEDSGSDQRQW